MLGCEMLLPNAVCWTGVRRSTMTVSFPEESAYPDVRDCGVSDIKVEDMSWDLDCFAPVRKGASSH